MKIKEIWDIIYKTNQKSWIMATLAYMNYLWLLSKDWKEVFRYIYDKEYEVEKNKNWVIIKINKKLWKT